MLNQIHLSRPRFIAQGHPHKVTDQKRYCIVWVSAQNLVVTFFMPAVLGLDTHSVLGREPSTSN